MIEKRVVEIEQDRVRFARSRHTFIIRRACMVD
jgi:hypothetical protein